MSRIFEELGERTLIMGILNVTPDSFSDGGRFERVEAAVAHARAMLKAGADLIDVGGESSRPGALPVSAEVELDRVLPVLEALKEASLGPVSIDTTKAEVARRAVELGATLINDISGLAFEPGLAEVAAVSGAYLILGHTRGRPQVMQQGEIQYPEGVVRAVERALESSVHRAHSAGVRPERIWVDPGFGFGKTLEHNLEIHRALHRFTQFGPVVVGTSRKRFIGTLTAREVDQRVFGSAASVALAVEKGASVVRVHDVDATFDVVRVADAICRPSSRSDGAHPGKEGS